MPPASPVDRHARRARFARACLGLACAALVAAGLLAACSLDWAVRPDPGGGPVPDVMVEASGDGPNVPDAAETSVPDGPVMPDASPCDSLVADVAQKRKKARECQFGAMGQCTTTVDDECACKVIVTSAGSTATTDYTSAVSALLACEKPDCGAPCPQLGLMNQWGCFTLGTEVRCNP